MNSGNRDHVENQDERLSAFAWIMTAMIGALLCLVQLGVMVSLMAARIGFAAVFPVSIILAAMLGGVLLRRAGFRISSSSIAVGLFLLAILLSLSLSAFFYDFSWDGQWYHQTGIIHIARDWNPLADPMRSFAPHLETWERHYAKGPWYFAAAVYQTTGHIEWGKAINWLALAAAFWAVLAACLNAGMRRLNALGIAAVVACNPVVMSEVTTYLVDAVMASFLVVAVAALFTCLRRPSAPATIAGVAAAIVTTNAKFTGLVFLCFALAAGLIWCVLRHRQWLSKYVAVTAASLFLAVIVWGWNPYVTNTWYRSQPFYPMLGSARYPSLEQANKDGNERWETPKNMVGRSLVVRFGYSIFGRPGNQPYVKGRNASLMWPFSARLEDLYAYHYHETRVAGFGPFFSGCLILSFLLGLILMVIQPTTRWPIVLITAAVIGSLLLSRHLWWPRYGPQFWLLPILPIALVFAERVTGYRLVMARVILVLLIADAAVVAWVRLQWETNASMTLRQQLKQMRASGQLYEIETNRFIESWPVRLREANVRFVDVEMKKLPDGQELKSVVEGYPLAIRYRVAAGSPSAAMGANAQGPGF
jgi:hypothetical protein